MEIFTGIITKVFINLSSAYIFGVIEKWKIDNILKYPLQRLVDTINNFWRSESISESVSEAILQRVGDCIFELRITIDDLLSVHFDSDLVIEEIKKRRIYNTHLQQIESETQHLFERLIKETIILICQELPRIESIHRNASIRAAQDAQEHYKTTDNQNKRTDNQLSEIIAKISEVSANQRETAELENSLHSVFQQQIKEIRKLINTDSLSQAEASVQTLLDSVLIVFKPLSLSDHSEAYAVAASLYTYKGDIETADAYLKEAEKMDPNNSRVLMIAAKLLAIHEDFDSALEKLAELDTENAQILKFAIKYQMGSATEYTDIIDELKQSKTSQAYVALASYYMSECDFNNAVEYARLAVNSEYNSHNYWMLGYSLVARMLERKYGHNHGFNNLATFIPTETEILDIKEAEENLNKAVEIAKDQLGPKDNRTIEREIHLLRCLTLYKQDAAEDYALKMLKDNPQNFEAARYLLYAGRIPDVVAVLGIIDPSELTNESDTRTLASILMEAGEVEKGLDTLIKWRDKHSIIEDYLYTSLLCRLYRILKQPQQAQDEISNFGNRIGHNIEQRKLVASHFSEIGMKLVAEDTVNEILETENNADNFLFAWVTLEPISDPQLIKEILLKLAALAPKKEFYILLIKHLFRLHDYTTIIDTVNAIKTLGLSDKSFDKAEATALFYLGDYTSAEPILTDVYKNQKSCGWMEQGLAFNLVMCDFALGKDESAIRIISELKEQQDVMPETYAVLIDHYDRVGLYQKAYEVSKEYALKFPTDERARASEIFHAMTLGYMMEASTKMQAYTNDFKESKIIWKIPVNDGPEYIASINNNHQKVWGMYQQGNLPRSFQNDFSRFAMAYDWALNTSNENYQKPPVYMTSYSQVASSNFDTAVIRKGIVLDYTSLLTLQSAGLLQKTLDAFEVIYYPPHLLTILLLELQKLSSVGRHVDQKKEVERLINTSCISTWEFSETWDEINAKLEQYYDSKNLGQLTAIRLYIAEHINGYYIDEYLLDNLHLDATGLQATTEKIIVTIRDIVNLLWDNKKLSGVNYNNAIQYIEKYGGDSKTRSGNRSEELSLDAPVIASLMTLETLCDIGILNELASAYKGRLFVAPFDVTELNSRLYEVEISRQAKETVESIRRTIIQCDKAKVVHLDMVDKVYVPDIIDEYSLTGLWYEAVNVALKKDTVLISDDRTTHRLEDTNLHRATTLNLINILRDSTITGDEYENAYISMLRWNCLFIPVDEFVLNRIFARIPVPNRDATLVAEYYDMAFQEAGLSAEPYSPGSIDSEAFRFYVNCNNTLTRVLNNVWTNPDLIKEHKLSASIYIRDSLWRKPEHLLHYFPEEELTESLQALWHVKMILGLEHGEPGVVSDLLNWYLSEWITPEITGESSILVNLKFNSSNTVVDIVSHARELKQQLSSIVRKELLAFI